MKTLLCPSCGSCGFPMCAPSDFAGGVVGAAYCNTCGDDQGRLRPYDEVLHDNAEFYVREQGLDRSAATEMARALLATMPAWKHRD
jgi:Na+-translocating ferredoxin:NAD+ oxidoreductase RNF subunit RnfB